MTCKQYRTTLEESEAGGTPRFTEGERAAHAGRCLACAAEAAGLREVSEALKRWGDVDAPAGLAERALALCAAETPRHLPAARRWRIGPLPWLVGGPALAAACAAAVLWLGGGRPLTGPTSSAPSLTSDERYALAALERAAEQVNRAEQHSWSAVERAAQALAEKEERP